MLSHEDVPKTVLELPIFFGCQCDSHQAMFKPLNVVPFDCILPLELCYLSLSDYILPLELCQPSLYFFDIYEQPHAFFVTPRIFVSCLAIAGII